MIRILPPVFLLLGLGCSAQPTEARPPADRAISSPDDARVQEAERLLAAGDPDGALTITDELLGAEPDQRAARLVAARANVALFESGRSGAAWFLDDAIHQYEAALSLDGNDPKTLLDLSWCRLRKSEFDEGRELALSAARMLQGQRAPDREVANALLRAAENEMQRFADARRAEMAEGIERPGDEVEQLAVQVLAILRDAERLGARDAAKVRASQVFQWMNRGMDALNELENGLRADPQSTAMNEAFQQMYWGMGMRAECVAVYKRLHRESKGSSAMLWYLGRAQVAQADDLRSKSSWDGAVRAYADALATYHSYDEQRPADHSGTAQWLAICELSLGRVAYEQGRLEDATGHFERAYEVCPHVAEFDESGMPRVFDSFGGNYLGGLSLVGQSISESTDADALARSLAFFERILDRHPDRFASIYNNAALSARDLGVQIAGGGEPVAEASEAGDRRERLQRAMELWEKSYAWYDKAAELMPDDARTLNDLGLMLIYHLHRDYDRARSLFEAAAAKGEEQLAALPADAADQRRFLEEAVGDAYQNLGVLLADRLGRPAAAARPYFEKAVNFYPNQRREAARRLRDSGDSAERGAGGTDQDPKPQDDPRKARFDAQIVDAQAAAERGDFDSALLTLDRMSDEMSGYPPYHAVAGAWSLGYAEQAAATGGSVGTVDGLFNDAVRHLRKAVELDGGPFQPRYDLGRALLATGSAAEAARVADELLSHVRSEGGAPEDFLVSVHALRAEAAARAYVEKKQAGEDDAELLRAMRTSFREIEATPSLDSARRSLWVATEQWAGAAEQAVQVMIRAWQRDPALVGELVETAAQAGSSGPVVEALADQEDATAIWYSGKAHFDLAVQQWSGGDAKQAIATLDTGIARFEASKAANAAFADSAEQWIALCLGQKGLVQLSQDDLAGAEESLLSAAERRPDVFTNDLGGGATIKRGLLIVADRHFKQGDLGKTAAIYRRAGKAVPNDVDIANNEGLFCRDHADRLAGRRSGELTDELRDLYEASYAAYTRASRIDPQSVRLRNDRALILVYSLKRDLELAEEILKSAIVDGNAQLQESPPEDEDELRALQEAVGDAHGNLGVLYRDQQRWEEAREHFQKSLEYYPFQRRIGTRQLQQLDELKRKAEEAAGGQPAGGEQRGGAGEGR